MNEDEKLLTFKEAMEYLRVSRSTVFRLMKREQLKAHKVGNNLRFYQKDVKGVVRLVEANSVRYQVKPIDTKGN